MARKRLPINQMNVVPYIDVMLVLLVIFMVTAPLVQTTTIDLPQSSQVKTAGKLPDFRVTWNGGDSYSWKLGDDPNEGAVVYGEKAVIKALQTSLKKSNFSKEDKPTLVFLASEKALYGEVMDRVDGLRENLPKIQVQLLMKKRTVPNT